MVWPRRKFGRGSLLCIKTYSSPIEKWIRCESALDLNVGVSNKPDIGTCLLDRRAGAGTNDRKPARICRWLWQIGRSVILDSTTSSDLNHGMTKLDKPQNSVSQNCDPQSSVAPLPIVPRRKITGISAILLPFKETGDVDWDGFRAHVQRTVDAGLIPAVNMDTGYGNLIDDQLKRTVLEEARALASENGFVAGAFVKDQPGDPFNVDSYSQAMEMIEANGGTPVIFQSYGLVEQNDDQIVASYEMLAKNCDQLIGFELANVFAPFGSIYSLDVYRQLVSIEKCIGAKHSSLSRELEWERLAIRNEVRPDFKVFTGNDLAIDMVMYGSDYLLGLSTFAPDYFAKRDAFWEKGDPRFYELNDWLQYLGFFSFRDPVPAYKHDAAMFLHLRNWIATDQTHPQSNARPPADREVLEKILEQLRNF